MPTLTLTPPGGGSPVSVSVDDSFSQLSPADQEQTVNEISSQVFKSTSPVTALRNSAGSIVSGLGAADKTIGQLAGKYAGGTMVGNGLQTWADTAGNVLNDAGQAISGDRQYDGQSIHRLGTDLSQGNLGGAAYDAAGAVASAAPYAATAALGPGGVAALAASGAGNTIQAREAAQGEQAPSGGDLLAGGASAALNALGGPLAHGVMGGIAGRLAAPEIASMASPVARAAARVALGAGAGGAMGAGNYALDNAGTGQGNLSGMGNAAIEGAGTGAIASPVAQGAGMGVKALQDARTAAQAGPDVQAYQKETAPWTAAVQQAAQTIKAANPNLDDDTVQQAAQAQANQQGLAAPTYDQLSPQAQNGMAKMGLLNLYNQRLQASTANMGRDTAEPAAVFKGVMDDLSGNIKQIGQGLADAGQISKDQIAPLNAAVAEAVRNNRVSARGGADLGYFDTARDQVANLPIDQSTKNTLLLNLNMLDLAQQNSMKGAAQGPLERNAGTLSTLGGAAAAAALGASGHGGSLGGLGLEELGIGGGLLGHYKGAVVRSGLRQLDQMMGTQLPPLLQNQQAIQDYAAQNNLQPGGAPVTSWPSRHSYGNRRLTIRPRRKQPRLPRPRNR
ncbi:hypothetical protein GT370_05935 [Acidocella sp. MX-AZ03]|uniref:hypothetical protein n=1 Tax=Acidocella sp. MX-AZ03 TaxID=2697363 RepID=UPI0022DD54CD|nr:hypothetical protein [Acidocella sp. MX-AZ03]WBO60345.1 hypothetical protein GT370_05935 [Acidocella sp. MX-AZ03]